MIWASPPCTEYGVATTVGTRKIDEANEIVLMTLEIIEYLNPKHFIIENPQTGSLKNQRFMHGLAFVDADYCKYGFPYRKRTRLWNNVSDWKPRDLCRKDCLSMSVSGKRHIATAQRGPTKSQPKNRMKQSELYRVPENLIYKIFKNI